MDRLLVAAQGLLGERRFEEATVAELAKRAGSSVGAFYARFPDKQALLRCFDERVFEEGRRQWQLFLDPQRWRGASLETIVTALVELGVTKRRTHRGLLRALALYVRSNPDPTFRERAAELNRFVTARLQALLASRHGEIRHPQPRLAIAFGLAVMDAVTREAIVFEDAGLNPAPMPDSRLARELTRAYLAYLGVRPRRRRGSGGSHAPRRKLRAG